MQLLELQAAFERAFAAPTAAPPEWLASADGADRLEVYRGTVLAVLVRALSLNFPAVRRLVGAEFFDWCAALYAADHLPSAANLDGYGEGFADFLQELPSCAGLAYLPEVARLDWAVARALHAEDSDALEPAALGAAAERADTLSFIAHPAVSLLACDFPADRTWSAVLGEEPGALERIGLACDPCWLLVERPGLRPRVSRLTRGEWQFARDLFSGQSLGDALSRADVEGAAPAWLAGHLAAGRVVGWRTDATKENR